MPETQRERIEEDYCNFKNKSEMRFVAREIFEGEEDGERLKLLFGLRREREQDELARQEEIDVFLRSRLPNKELTKAERSFFIRSLTARYLVEYHPELYRRSPFGNLPKPYLAPPFVDNRRYGIEKALIDAECDASGLYKELSRPGKGSGRKGNPRKNIMRGIKRLAGIAVISTIVGGTAFRHDVKKIARSIEMVLLNRESIAITLGLQDAEVPDPDTVHPDIWGDLSSKFTVSLFTEDSGEADPTTAGASSAPTATKTPELITATIAPDHPAGESISATSEPQGDIVEDQTKLPPQNNDPGYEVENTADNLHEMLIKTLLNSAIGYKEHVENTQDLTDDQKEELLAEIGTLIEKYTDFKGNFVINLVITDRDGSGSGGRAYYSGGNEHVGASDGIFQVQLTPDGEIFVFSLGRDNPVRWVINQGAGKFSSGGMTTAENLNSLVPGKKNADGSLMTALDNGGMQFAFGAIFGDSGDLNIRLNLAVLNDLFTELFPNGVDLTFSERFVNRYLSYEAGEHHLSGSDLQKLLRQREGIEGGSTNRGIGMLKQILSNPSNILSLIASMDTDFWDVIWDQDLNDSDRSLTVSGSQDKLVFYLLAAMFDSNNDLGQTVLGLVGRSLKDGNFGPNNFIALEPAYDGNYSVQVDEVLSQ